VLRWLISFLAVGVAVIAQLTIVDRITFPGGTGPDLVLLAVVALALANGPLPGTLIGFLAGLALDVAPPGSHYVGQDALVFCLIGYACGLAAENPASDGVPEQGHTALFEIAVTAAGAIVGEALMALLGVMLSDPRVTWAAIKHVLPVAAAYDLVLAPFALYAAAALLRLAGTRGESRRAAFAPHPVGSAVAAAGHGATRAVGGNTPKLRLSESSKGDGWLAGQRGQAARPVPKREPSLKLGTLRGQSAAVRPAPKSATKREPNLKLSGSGSYGAGAGRKPMPRREPNLRLGRGGTLAGSALGAAFASGGSWGSGGHGSAVAGALGGSARVRFSSRAQGGVLGGSSGGSARLRSSRFGSTRMGRSLLGGSVFSRPGPMLGGSASFSRPSQPGRAARVGRSAFLGGPSRGLSWLGRTSPSSPSSFLGRPSLFGGRRSSWRGAGGPTRSVPRRLAPGHAPKFSSGTAPSPFSRLTAALRLRPRPKSALSRRSLAQSALSRRSLGRSGTALGASALDRSSGRKLPGRGWMRRGTPRRGALGRGLAGGGTPRVRFGSTRSGVSARLSMPRSRLLKKKRHWRTGGYR